MADGRRAIPMYPPLPVSWAEAVVRLAERGWFSAPAALAEPWRSALDDDDRRVWKPLMDQEVAQQHGSGAYLPIEETHEPVRILGRQLVTGLSSAAHHQHLPPLPDFNEVTWTRYPARTGRITAHRDPNAYGGVIAVATLRGAATFRVLDITGQLREWRTGAGTLVLLRGRGWPNVTDLGPVHEAEPPEEGERVALTLRTNLGGAGGAGGVRRRGSA